MIKIVCRGCGSERTATLGEIIFSGIHLFPWLHIGFCPECDRLRIHDVRLVKGEPGSLNGA